MGQLLPITVAYADGRNAPKADLDRAVMEWHAGGFAGMAMHSVDSVRTVFHRSRGIFQLRTTDAP